MEESGERNVEQWSTLGSTFEVLYFSQDQMNHPDAIYDTYYWIDR